MKHWLFLVVSLIFGSVLPIHSFAGTNVGVSYQGRILRPSGEAVNSGVIAFSLRVFDSSNNCLLWSEIQNLNMANTGGAFSLVIGAGTRTDGGSHTLKQVFMNAGTLSSLACTTGSTYSPTSNEDRNLVVSFNDGGTVVALNPMAIKSAPFAMQADQVSGYGIMNLAKISGAGTASTLSPFQFDFLAALSEPASASSTPCATNEILKYDGTSWACAADATGGTPSDAGYGAKGVLQFNTDAATSGVSIAAGVATLNTGINANQILKLDASANLGVGIVPTSKLDVNGAITQRGMAAPAVSAAGTGRIYYDSTNNHFYYSENGGAYTQLSSATGSLSSVSSISNSGGNITLAPTASTGSVLVSSGTASVGTASGALVVTGGIGASGSLYAGGSINAGTTVTATTSVYSPQIYGSSAASGTLSLDGTSHATKGNILMNVSGGNVGIGTASPGYKLQVDSADTAIYGTTTNAVSLIAGVQGSASSFGAGVYGTSTFGFGVVGVAVNSGSTSPGVFGQSYGTGPGVQGNSSLGSSGFFQSQSATNTVSTLVTQQLSTSTADLFQAQNAAGTSLFKITSGGSVGIGTTAPTQALEVVGTVQATDFVTTSDRRYKRDIASIDDALEKIRQINGVTWKWISDGTTDMGVIAQDVEKVFPELVVTNSNGRKSVKYGNLIGPLIEATKSLKSENEELKSRLELMERRLEKLEAKSEAK